MVDVVLVRHALDAVPPAATHVGDVGGPVVPGGPHDVVHCFLLVGVGSEPVLVCGEPGLRPIN